MSFLVITRTDQSLGIFGFTPPLPLNTNADSDSPLSSGNDYSPQIASDSSGKWIAVWSSRENLGGVAGNDWDIFVASSQDQGRTWTDPALLNTNATTDKADDRSPQLVTDGAGTWITIWESREFLGGSPVTDGDILFSRSENYGETWSDPENLNSNADTDTGTDWFSQLTTDGAGHWIAAWTSSENLTGTIGTDWDILTCHSLDNARSWSDPEVLNSSAGTDIGTDFAPQIVTDKAGRWITVWQTSDWPTANNGELDILFSISDDNGSHWTEAKALNAVFLSDDLSDIRPRLATDGNGHWVAVWYYCKNINGGIGQEKDIYVSQSSDNGEHWSVPSPLNSNYNADRGSDFYPRVETDRLGNWLAVWYSSEALGGLQTFDNDIFVSRSIDNGVTWTSVANLNANATSDIGDDEDPCLIVDSPGNWVCAWSSNEDFGDTLGRDYDILFSTSDNLDATPVPTLTPMLTPMPSQTPTPSATPVKSTIQLH